MTPLNNKPGLINLFSVLAGSIIPFITGLIFYPIVRIIFDKYFHLFSEYNSKDDLIITITLILWVLLSAIVGGIVTTFIAKSHEWLYSFLSFLVVLVVFIIISKGEIFDNPTTVSILVILMLPIGFLFGNIIATLIKRKKRKKTESITSDISSFHFDNPEQ